MSGTFTTGKGWLDFEAMERSRSDAEAIEQGEAAGCDARAGKNDVGVDEEVDAEDAFLVRNGLGHLLDAPRVNETVSYTPDRWKRRSLARERAIVIAAADALLELGYTPLTVDLIARRARASKATIYRHWPSMADLMLAVVESVAKPIVELPDTGNLRRDVLAAVSAVTDPSARSYVAVMHELMIAARTDKALAGWVPDTLESNEFDPIYSALKRADSRGELRHELDFAAIQEIAEALIIRQRHLQLPIDDDFTSDVVDRILLPLVVM